MTIAQSLHHALVRCRASSQSAQLDAEVLLAHVLRRPIEYLLSHPERVVSTPQKARYDRLLKKRALGWPIAYLTGEKEFYRLRFFVSPKVLIPRPETERLIDYVINNPLSLRTGINIVDIGTGSGNLVVTLAQYLKKAKFFATDISSSALRLAAKNARCHGVSGRIRFCLGSLLAPVRQSRVDIVVANLPYLTRDQIRRSPTPEIRFEPKHALDGGKRGFDIIQTFLRQLAERKRQPSLVVLEIDPAQKKPLFSAVHGLLPSDLITFLTDYTGKTRFAVIQPKPSQR
ncbi:MAG: peptide chain release factor N(5)-glutamine methyltransferase [Patescibacteria group bacterium]